MEIVTLSTKKLDKPAFLQTCLAVTKNSVSGPIVVDPGIGHTISGVSYTLNDDDKMILEVRRVGNAIHTRLLLVKP